MIDKILLIALALILINCDLTPGESKEVNVKGRLALVGSEPFTSLALKETKFGTIHLPMKMKKEYLEGQQHIVEIKGVIMMKELITADLKITNHQLQFNEIKNLKIIKPAY